MAIPAKGPEVHSLIRLLEFKNEPSLFVLEQEMRDDWCKAQDSARICVA